MGPTSCLDAEMKKLSLVMLGIKPRSSVFTVVRGGAAGRSLVRLLRGPSGRFMALRSTQTVIFQRKSVFGAQGWPTYHLHVPIVWKSRSLRILEHKGYILTFWPRSLLWLQVRGVVCHTEGRIHDLGWVCFRMGWWGSYLTLKGGMYKEMQETA